MLVSILVLALQTLPAQAERTIDARQFTCAQLQQIVKKERSVLIRSGWYGARFVKSKYDCGVHEKTVDNAYLASADTRRCRPGLLCRVKFPGE